MICAEKGSEKVTMCGVYMPIIKSKQGKKAPMCLGHIFTM